ncbi:MAG TPA: SUMF1/EgtB/PvdO family nonheme iron enzyme [Tepidisphaeraceae bacterium]|jgi:acyl carrier protein
MANEARLTLQQIESRVCDIAAEQLGLRRTDVHPGLRVIQDLHCDSLEIIELILSVEDAFDVALPDDPPNMAYKSVFTRDPFRLSDLAELVHLQQGCRRVKRAGWWGNKAPPPASPVVPFTQLGGSVALDAYRSGPLYEPLGYNKRGFPTFRRRVDGMICVRVPSAEVVLGTDDAGASADERPAHRVRLDAFLIDQEPVSTTAYCRFLNSTGPVDAAVLQDWFALAPADRRREHQLVRQNGDGWAPAKGTERMPMMLVSWFGANAYSLWANRRDWTAYHGQLPGDEACLPTEAQWEYAARGGDARTFPWGDGEPAADRLQFAQHSPGRRYRPETLPMADVNAELGMSAFGLHHMAGNVWQWCRDWYSPSFYETPEASKANPVNRQPSRVRSERGGSWIGPAFLCRATYRRGRVPTAKGRCLGFRCVGDPDEVSGRTC